MASSFDPNTTNGTDRFTSQEQAVLASVLQEVDETLSRISCLRPAAAGVVRYAIRVDRTPPEALTPAIVAAIETHYRTGGWYQATYHAGFLSLHSARVGGS